MRYIVIIGATSAIALATAHIFAKNGDQLLLVARDADEVTRIAADIGIRYGQVPAILIADLAITPNFLAEVLTLMPKVDGLLFASGYLGEDPQRLLHSNFTDVIGVLDVWATYFALRRCGWMIVLTSIAGDRGRQANCLYGAAKGGLSIYLQGLRQRLFRAGVRVIDIKPGPIDTPMTYGLSGLPALSTTERIAAQIAHSPAHRRNVIYLPWFWRWIMAIVKCLPDWLFNRLSF